VTIVESQAEVDPVIDSGTATPAGVQKPLSVARPRIVRVAVIALVVVVVGWVAYTVFEGPIAGAWYRNRQRQLESQLEAARPHTGLGAAIAIMQIPRLGTNLVIAEGDSPQQLRSGPGHRFGTPLPGDVGNSVVVGHRSGWGGPFARLDAVKRGDLIVVQTQNEQTGPRNAVFKVVSISDVAGNDTSPLEPTTDRRLTILTGRGGQFSDGRLAVVAVSGTVGKVRPTSAVLKAETSSGSELFNEQMLLALLGLGGAVLLGFGLRRRYRKGVVIIAVAPLATLGVLGLLLNVDLFAPVLR
jgi:sortase A